MSLKIIGMLPANASFGTGDRATLEKETLVEPRVNELILDYLGKPVAHLVDGEHRIERTTRYAGLTEANMNPLNAGVTKFTLMATNGDFCKAQVEKESYA